MLPVTLSAVPAAAVTVSSVYAAPYDTGNGMIPLGMMGARLPLLISELSCQQEDFMINEVKLGVYDDCLCFWKSLNMQVNTILWLSAGNLRSVDKGGPYDLKGLNTSAAHVKGDDGASCCSAHLQAECTVA